MCSACQASAAARESADTEASIAKRESHNAREAKEVVPLFLKGMADRGNPGSETGLKLAMREGRYERTDTTLPIWPLATGSYTSGKWFGADGVLYNSGGPQNLHQGIRWWLHFGPPVLVQVITPARDLDMRLAISDGDLARNLRAIARAHRVPLPPRAWM